MSVVLTAGAGPGTDALAVLLVLATAVWIGGFVAIMVVARVATRALPRPARVALFRGLGRTYGMVGGVALVVALATGGALLAGRPWTGQLTAAAVLAGCLLVGTTLGVVQARHMTRIRRHALANPDDVDAPARVRRGAQRAAWLRGLIGALNLALLIVGVLLAT